MVARWIAVSSRALGSYDRICACGLRRWIHDHAGQQRAVGCNADWARCDIIDRDWSPPPRPADCEFDYGQGISLAPGEQAEFVCAGDTAFGADEVLPYGQSITAEVLQCESAQSGITCRDVRTGHGFSISRQAYRLF
jgi:hypothetical protein